MYVNTRTGVLMVPKHLVDTARVQGATPADVLRRVILPSAAPHILAGIRIAFPYAIGAAIAAELLSANRGLGYLVELGVSNFDMPGALVGVGAAALVALAGRAMIAWLERSVRPWRSGDADVPPLF